MTKTEFETYAPSRESRTSLARLLPRLRAAFPEAVDTPEWQALEARLELHFHRLFALLRTLYGSGYDFFYHLETIVATAARMWMDRPAELKALDALRESDPQWFQSHLEIGAMAYTDLFAGDLAGLRSRIPYLQEVGITYLHLMPLFRTPPGDDDGGYAISSYREVDPPLGKIADLEDLAGELRRHGISLVLDFVFNHTSDDHEWARRAMAGEEEFQEFYRMFETREQPDLYERTIRSIFPEEHPGCFTYRNRIRRWVWTTFHNYQWDLNYENPAVFNAMAGEMLFLANLGVEVLRLDAVPFLWKRPGTDCENLPEAHLLIQAFNAVARIAAPALLFKSEAIVAPEEILRYLGPEECQISYNPLLMALLWEALATRSARLLRHTVDKRFAIPAECAWVNYIRCHDDIGWGFSDEDMRELGMNPADHRRFLNAFYTGRHEFSFARGLPFQENPQTGDARVCGTTASLCGLERAQELGDPREVDLAVRRILLLHGILFTIGGIPLVYLGDEIGTLNDYGYTADLDKDGDSRWVHRPPFDWTRAGRRQDPALVEGRIFQGLLRLAQVRRAHLAFTRSETEIIDAGNDHVFGYFRTGDQQSVLCLANFSDHAQEIPAVRIRQLGLRRTLTDIASGRAIVAAQTLALAPYDFLVLVGAQS